VSHTCRLKAIRPQILADASRIRAARTSLADRVRPKESLGQRSRIWSCRRRGFDAAWGVHDDQVQVSHQQVVALVADELPDLAGLDVVDVSGAGTVNAIYRIGDDVAARLPLRRADPAEVLIRLRRETAAAAEFRRASSVPAPEPLHIGRPGHGYPMPWTAQSWLPGTTATPTSCEASATLAQDLSVLIGKLREWDTGGRRFEGEGRGGELTDHDDWLDECIRRNADSFDPRAMRTMWADLRRLLRQDPDVMCHTDLIPSNLLVDDGQLVGVLDTGGFQPADPALDLVSAWHLLSDEPRRQLRTSLGCSDLQWERGKAWAFQQAAGLPWYYRDSNPAMATMGTTTLHRLLEEQ
jgi:aminoglycoside phosphotransferase (APT) family kinase protein